MIFKKSIYLISSLFVIFGTCVLPLQANPVIPEIKVTASEGTTGFNHGHIVDIDGDYAITGSWNSNSYIFKKEGASWVQQDILTGPGKGLKGDAAISGPYAIIGSHSSAPGSAYIFKRTGSTWTQQIRLVAPDSGNAKIFGAYVVMDGDYAVVGDHQNDSNKGAVYVFKRDGDTWAHQAKLTAFTPAAGEYFGHTHSIDGDRIAVGTPFAGPVYIFRRDDQTWLQEAQLTAAGAINFGKLVSISGDYVIVGAEGAAYIFKRNGTTWTQQAMLTDASASDQFGRWVSLSGDMAVVSARLKDSNGLADSGAVFVYQRNGGSWELKKEITPADAAASDVFGHGLEITGDQLIVGAPQNDDQGENSGSAYIYDLANLGSATITITPDNPTPAVGDTLCVDINIADAAGLYSSAFDLTFDHTALHYQSASEGSFLNADSGATMFEAALLNGQQSNDVVVVGVSRAGDIGLVSGSGTIAKVCFSVVGGSGGSVTVGITNGYFEGGTPGTSIPVTTGTDPVIPIEIGTIQNLVVTDPGTRERLDLSWDAAVDASDYEIYRADKSGGTFTQISTTTSTNYQDNDCILAGVSYTYKIKAIAANGSGTGDFSAEASGTVAGLHGDINKDNRIDGRDLTILARAFNTVPENADYNCQANLDRLQGIDGGDLMVITTGFGTKL